MMRATELAHAALRSAVRPGDWAIDATAGNGHDTLFLAGLVGPEGRVWGFDVQAAAVSSARARLAGQDQASLVLAGHEEMRRHLPAEAAGRIAAVTFNLGYLPGAGHEVITRPDTTLAALTQALDLLAPGGIITLVLYPGHPGGADEADAIKAYACTLPATVSAAHYGRLNAAKPAPELLIIEQGKRPA